MFIYAILCILLNLVVLSILMFTFPNLVDYSPTNLIKRHKQITNIMTAVILSLRIRLFPYKIGPSPTESRVTTHSLYCLTNMYKTMPHAMLVVHNIVYGYIDHSETHTHTHARTVQYS